MGFISSHDFELHMRRTKLSELSLWQARRLTQLSSSDLIWIDQHVLTSIRLIQTDRTCEDRLRDKRRSFHEANLMNKLKICTIMFILASMPKHLWLNLVGRIMFHVWLNGRALPCWVDPNYNLVRLIWSWTFAAVLNAMSVHTYLQCTTIGPMTSNGLAYTLTSFSHSSTLQMSCRMVCPDHGLPSSGQWRKWKWRIFLYSLGSWWEPNKYSMKSR